MVSIDGKTMCAVCAWRKNCKKKFKVSAGEAHCPDFSRDVQLQVDDKRNSDDNGKVKS